MLRVRFIGQGVGSRGDHPHPGREGGRCGGSGEGGRGEGGQRGERGGGKKISHKESLRPKP